MQVRGGAGGAQRPIFYPTSTRALAQPVRQGGFARCRRQPVMRRCATGRRCRRSGTERQPRQTVPVRPIIASGASSGAVLSGCAEFDRRALVTMTAEAEAVLREALALPEEDRANVAAELLASLDVPAADDPDTVRALWGQETSGGRSECCPERASVKTGPAFVNASPTNWLRESPGPIQTRGNSRARRRGAVVRSSVMPPRSRPPRCGQFGR